MTLRHDSRSHLNSRSAQHNVFQRMLCTVHAAYPADRNVYRLRDGRHRPAAVYRYNPDRSRASTAPPVGPPRDAPTIEELEDQRIEDALSALMPSARA